MPKDPSILQIELMFRGLNTTIAANSYPIAGALSTELNNLVDTTKKEDYTINIEQGTAKKFATAAVEMWHRSVHSFLISASLTKSSPVWSSVSGYYSSHYSIRGFAHLLGHFQLFKKRKVIQLEISGQHYYCHVTKKNGGDREHKLCWQLVKKYSLFANDPFFTVNDDSQNQSDGGHRNKANYQDHIGRFPNFQPLDEAYLKSRISLISSIELSDAPIPNIDSYPDLENVQLIAYHRLVRFRMFLDEILGGSNKFWSANRSPDWCPNYLNFQVTQPQYANIYQGIV
jgi:hypothetical protein